MSKKYYTTLTLEIDIDEADEPYLTGEAIDKKTYDYKDFDPFDVVNSAIINRNAYCDVCNGMYVYDENGKLIREYGV